ncbi:ATP-binding protein [Massilia sp. METH4]|uniref:ATP-binding protein n=1 Tax=Massilia sp. METH4 TaxID=3123041 RepID=UPI0030D4AA0E
MEHIENIMPGLAGRLAMLAGECAQHGAAEILARAGAAWHCPRCLEAQLLAERTTGWMAERAVALLSGATIPAKYVDQQFVASTPEQKEARRTVRMFRDFILKEQAWASLVMIGTTGTGKTLLACEMAQSLIKNASRSVRYITATGMIGEIQASYGREGKSEEGEILRFVQYDVLILDEIDAIRATGNAALLLTEIVNRRYNENKPMIAISNQPFADLARFVGDRVYSRLHENAFVAAFNWADARRGGIQQSADVHHLADAWRA